MYICMYYTGEMGLIQLLLCTMVFISESKGMHGQDQKSGEIQEHHDIIDIQKRQVDGNDRAELCESVLGDFLCTSGVYQAYADLMLQCSMPEGAVGLQTFCRTNRAGDRCTWAQRNRLGDICAESFDDVCTTECRNQLVQTREELGCCINLLNNSRISSEEELKDFNYTLWSLCDVEPVTEECRLGPIQLTPTVLMINDCDSQDDLRRRRLTDVFCSQDLRERLQGSVGGFDNSEGCLNLTVLPEMCAVSEGGEYCELLPGNHNDLFQAAEESCRDDVEACSSSCRGALGNIASMAGCCFMEDHNRTERGFKPNWLSFGFWSECGLTSPGFCERRLAVASPDNIATGATTTESISSSDSEVPGITDNPGVTSNPDPNGFQSSQACTTNASMAVIILLTAVFIPFQPPF